MKLLGVTAVLVLLVAVQAQIQVLRPECDSPEAEEAALVAQDYLNAQHTHGYKYALNRIEDIKVFAKPDGDNTYILEVDLLETDCHVLDSTPIANCTVRPKVLTAVEGDCDVVLKRVAGALTVTAFKCKTEESTEDLCLGCPTLLPLNDTKALDFVQATLATFNNGTVNATFNVVEVGRMSSQLVSGGSIYIAEYIVGEANCTGDACELSNDVMAGRGICSARGLTADHTVDCKMFVTEVPVADANSTTAAAPVQPSVHVHTGSLSRNHGLRYHRLTTMHDPTLTGLLSAESAESAEVVPVAPAAAAPVAPALNLVDSVSASDGSTSKEIPIHIVKRDVSVLPAPEVAASPAVLTQPIVLVPVCPGRIRFFD